MEIGGQGLCNPLKSEGELIADRKGQVVGILVIQVLEFRALFVCVYLQRVIPVVQQSEINAVVAGYVPFCPQAGPDTVEHCCFVAQKLIVGPDLVIFIKYGVEGRVVETVLQFDIGIRLQWSVASVT